MGGGTGSRTAWKDAEHYRDTTWAALGLNLAALEQHWLAGL